MATIKLLNNGRTYSEPPMSPWINMVNGQYIANSTVTSNTVSCYLFRNASGASSVRSYITVGNPSTTLTSTVSESNFSYSYDVSNYQKVDVEFLDAGTIPGTDIVLQSIHILPYVNINYSTSMGTAPSSQEVYYNSKLTLANLPTISVTNYKFDGWYYDSNYSSKANAGDSVTSDIKLYAKFTLINNIDFSTIKSLSIPEGVVKKITDAQGNILWKEPESWHKIWSGSKTVKIQDSSISGTSSNFVSTEAGTGTSPKLRITFQMTPSSPSDYKYQWFKNGASTYNGAYASPSEITVTNNRILGVRMYDSENYSDISLTRSNGSNNNINLSLTATNNIRFGTISLKVTKIEQYY